MKDAFFRVGKAVDLQGVEERLDEVISVEEVDAPAARRFKHDAVAFAAVSGLSPCHDYPEIEAIFADTPLGERTFTFGVNGKPLFMPGPYHTPLKVQRVPAALTADLGPDGYEDVLPFADNEFGDYEDDDDFEIDGQILEGELTAAEEADVASDEGVASEAIAQSN